MELFQIRSSWPIVRLLDRARKQTYKNYFYFSLSMVIRRFIFVILCLIVVLPFVYAGITPGRYEVDYVPGQKSAFPFTFVSSNPDSRFEISLKGDFAPYAQVSDSVIRSTGTVITYVTMPDVVDVPGVHKVVVVGSEIAETGGLGISGEARGLIFIHVPYPGRYLEVALETPNVNQGEPVNVRATVINRGKETVSADVSVDIYREREFIERLILGNRVIAPTESPTFDGVLNTDTYAPGIYRAVALVTYGEDEAIAESGFRVGTLSVDLVNYTRFIQRDKINRVGFDVESQWNSPIDSVFANVTLDGTDISFLTPTVALDPFGRATLVGFFDTTGLSEEKYLARVVLNYEGISREETVEFTFVRELSYLLVAGIIVGVMVILLGVWFFLRRRNTDKRVTSKR